MFCVGHIYFVGKVRREIKLCGFFLWVSVSFVQLSHLVIDSTARVAFRLEPSEGGLLRNPFVGRSPSRGR